VAKDNEMGQHQSNCNLQEGITKQLELFKSSLLAFLEAPTLEKMETLVDRMKNQRAEMEDLTVMEDSRKLRSRIEKMDELGEKNANIERKAG